MNEKCQDEISFSFLSAFGRLPAFSRDVADDGNNNDGGKKRRKKTGVNEH